MIGSIEFYGKVEVDRRLRALGYPLLWAMPLPAKRALVVEQEVLADLESRDDWEVLLLSRDRAGWNQLFVLFTAGIIKAQDRAIAESRLEALRNG